MPGLRVYLATACLLMLALPARAAEPAPPQPVERMPPQEAMAVLGAAVSQPDGKPIGHLVDVLVDPAGAPQAGVIDVGGFLGVGSRKIAVHWSTLHFAPGNTRQPITVDLTLDQLKTAPEYRSPAQAAPVVLAAPHVETTGLSPGASPPSPGPAKDMGATPAGTAPAAATPAGTAPAAAAPGGTLPAAAAPGGPPPASAAIGAPAGTSPPAPPVAAPPAAATAAPPAGAPSATPQPASAGTAAAAVPPAGAPSATPPPATAGPAAAAAPPASSAPATATLPSGGPVSTVGSPAAEGPSATPAQPRR